MLRSSKKKRQIVLPSIESSLKKLSQLKKNRAESVGNRIAKSRKRIHSLHSKPERKNPRISLFKKNPRIEAMRINLQLNLGAIHTSVM